MYTIGRKYIPDIYELAKLANYLFQMIYFSHEILYQTKNVDGMNNYSSQQ